MKRHVFTGTNGRKIGSNESSGGGKEARKGEKYGEISVYTLLKVLKFYINKDHKSSSL